METRRLAATAWAVVLAVGAAATGATYTEDFEIGGSPTFGTSDPRAASEVGWTAFSDSAFSDALTEVLTHGGAGNGVCVANMKYTGKLDFTTRYAFMESDTTNATNTNPEYQETVWYTDELLSGEPADATLDIDGATATWQLEGGTNDTGNGNNGGRSSLMVRLSDGTWYVSDYKQTSGGTDGIKNASLAIDTATLWDALALDSGAAAGSRILLTDADVTLSAADLADVDCVGFYWLGRNNDGNELPAGIDNFGLDEYEVASPAVIPEPVTLLALFGVLGALGGYVRRRR